LVVPGGQRIVAQSAIAILGGQQLEVLVEICGKPQVGLEVAPNELFDWNLYWYLQNMKAVLQYCEVLPEVGYSVCRENHLLQWHDIFENQVQKLAVNRARAQFLDALDVSLQGLVDPFAYCGRDLHQGLLLRG